MAIGMKNALRVATGTALAGLALIGTTGVANAQEERQATKPLAIKIGGYFPSSKTARDRAGSVAFAVDVDYTFQNLVNTDVVAYNTLNIGYIERNDLRIVPITLSEIYRGAHNTSSFDYYVGVGIGGYVTRVRNLSDDEKTRILLGGYVVAGLGLTKNIFAEVKYHYISRYADNYVGGFQVSVGTHF